MAESFRRVEKSMDMPELTGLLKDDMEMFNEKLNMYDSLDENPDTYGCDRLFARSFVLTSKAMTDDFVFIFKDFIAHEYKNLDGYDTVPYVEYVEDGGNNALMLLVYTGMNMMMNAVAAGSTYAKSLFLYLFRTYHGDVYKVAKRFSRLTRKDIEAVSGLTGKIMRDDTEEAESELWEAVRKAALIIYMSRINGTELAPDCNLLYALLDTFYEGYFLPMYAKRRDFRERVGKDYSQCVLDAATWYGAYDLADSDEAVADFADACSHWIGFTSDSVVGDGFDDGTERIDRGAALLLLRHACPDLCDDDGNFPDEVFSFAFQLLKQIKHTAYNGMLVPHALLGSLFPGYARSAEYKPVLFDAAKIKANEETPKPEPKKEKKMEDADEKKALLEQINELRLKLHTAESENRALRENISAVKSLKEENKGLNDRLAELNKETSALRSYVYGLTEEDIVVEQADYEKMKKELREKRIVIIGGHMNWIQKMKSEFPGWKIVPKAAGNSDVSVVSGADAVYFFSDSLDHSTYYRYLNVLREHNIDFGYIHGVNIERNVKHIYDDMAKNRK